ncbi:hypothetical protein GT646_07590 [Clostridium butyricum]|uniref:hypothetical protein n=1 Tax=Clostridium butyricum TaxID=1492 RepID=UPI00136E7739|nr:hypothetical protein [Clostridium butyricum]MZI80706.1 hypothetical protein [Clostridium butyricum]
MAIYDLKANLDLKQNMNIYATCKQLDNLNLILYIYDNSIQVNLSSYTVRLKAMKADKVPLVQQGTGISISNNVVTIECDEQLTTTSGKTLIELQFIDNATGKKKATFNLVLIVVASTLADGATISKSTYTLLEELENKMDQASDFFENIDEAITANNNLQDSISTGNTLKTNLDNNITTGNTLNNDLETNISAGNILKPNLEGAVTSANTAKAELDISIQDANTFVSEHGDIIDLDNRVTQNTSQLNDIEKKKANQYYVDIIKDYNAVCDGVTDISEIVQKAIDDISASGGGTLFFPKINNNQYRFSNISLKHGVSIISNNAVFKSSDSTNNMFNLANGAITNSNYNYTIKGIKIVANENNPNQIIFDFSALKSDSNGGGLWHASLKDITIGGLNQNMIGIHLYANDEENEYVDVVNQYISFDNVNIYRKSENASCLKVKGQLGQATFKNCEFNGSSKDLGGYNVYLESIKKNNDYLFGCLSFENVTIQTSHYGLYSSYSTELKIDGCWFENLKNAISIDDNTNLKLDNTHLSNCGVDDGSENIITFGDNCRITGDNNYIIGGRGIYLNSKTDSTISKGIDVKFNIHGSNTYMNMRNTTPIIDIDSYKIYSYDYKTICTELTQAIKLTEIQGEQTEGDLLTIVNISSDDTKYLKVCSGINILMPKGINTIKLLENQSITLKKISPIGKNMIRWIVVNYTGEVSTE